MRNIAKTKIIATIGPSSWDKDILTKMIEEGMDVARINASFADFEELDRVSKLIRSISPRISIMLDTKGHKIRVSGFEDEKVLKEGDTLNIVSQIDSGLNENEISVTYPNLISYVPRNTRILLDDGNIILEVKDFSNDIIICNVVQGGVLKNNKTVNIPNVHLDFPALSKKDEDDIKFAVENDFDYISASFIRNIEDVNVIKEIIGDSHTKLIAKIENYEGVENFNEILEGVDGIMVARGDLGVELPLEQVPILQKKFIYKCREKGKISIVATQMLESMRESTRPTRAEVSDVANAVIDGTDSVMLSAETSTGKYPVDVIIQMNKICFEVEKNLLPQKIMGRTSASEETDVLCWNVCDIVDSLSLKGIIVVSRSGRTIMSISRHRPNVPIWEICNSVESVRQNNMIRGVKGYFLNHFSADRDEIIKKSVETIYSYGELELLDKIAIISGSSIKNHTTNSIVEIVRVKDILR